MARPYPGGQHEFYLDVLRAGLKHDRDAEDRLAQFLADDVIAEAEDALGG